MMIGLEEAGLEEEVCSFKIGERNINNELWW